VKESGHSLIRGIMPGDTEKNTKHSVPAEMRTGTSGIQVRNGTA
jgi:hypothetical protein